MPGDISRRTFNREKRYTGVLAQQGRVLTDADLNEQLEIARHRTAAEAIDTIGACGVPKLVDGFRIGKTPDGSDLTVSPGRIYVDGLLCELFADAVPLSFPATATASQGAVPDIVVNGRALAPGQWVEISATGITAAQFRIVSVDATANLLTFAGSVSAFKGSADAGLRRVETYTTQPDYPDPEFAISSFSPPGFETVSLSDGRYVAHVKAFQREVNYIDDPAIRETALGGPDTGTRMQNIWQVRLVKVTPPSGKVECKTSFPEWDASTAASTGMLKARTKLPDDPTTPCVLAPTAGFRRLENQLYRVEIHKGGPRASATFKWSRENASVETGIQVNGNTIVADSVGKDDVLGFAGNQWVEIVDEASSLNLAPNDLAQIDKLEPGTREITTKTSISEFSGRKNLKLRRWEQGGGSATKDGVAITPGWLDLEDGVQVLFAEGTYQSGDYWLIPARTGTGDIEWPRHDDAGRTPIAQPPVGIRRHYCRLALLTVAGGAITKIEDCRELFPPLTAIAASDVSYDGSHCANLAGADTVQEALDILCQSARGECTLIAVPGESLQAVFDQIPAGGDAQVCFPVGTFPVGSTVVVEKKGRLKINGAGTGTRIVASNSEAALIFRECASVTIRDLYAETGQPGVNKNETNLLGTITVLDSPIVEMRSVSVKCAPSPVLAGTCITVRNTTATATNMVNPSARINGCSLEVGNLQTGILLVNVARSHIEDNDIAVGAKPPSLSFDNLVLNRDFRLALASRLISNAVMGTKPPAGGITNASIAFGGKTILFKTHPLLKQDLGKLVAARPPVANATSVQLLAQFKQTVSDALIDPVLRAASPKLVQWFDEARAADIAVASQGIVIGGSVANDVRVLNNTLQGMRQGIHAGLSQRGGLGTPAAVAGTVVIANNTIQVPLTQDAVKSARHAIFVGNCQSLSIENNRASLVRVSGAENITITGAITFGFLGRRVLFRHNHLTGFSTGLEFSPRFPFPPAAQVLWLAADNLFESVPAPFKFPPAPHNNPPLDRPGNKQM